MTFYALMLLWITLVIIGLRCKAKPLCFLNWWVSPWVSSIHSSIRALTLYWLPKEIWPEHHAMSCYTAKLMFTEISKRLICFFVHCLLNLHWHIDQFHLTACRFSSRDFWNTWKILIPTQWYCMPELVSTTTIHNMQDILKVSCLYGQTTNGS